MRRYNAPPDSVCRWYIEIQTNDARVVFRNGPNTSKWRHTGRILHGSGKWTAKAIVDHERDNGKHVWFSKARQYRNKRAVMRAVAKIRAEFPQCTMIIHRWVKDRRTRAWMTDRWLNEPGFKLYAK